jgi:hypothetical protein
MRIKCLIASCDNEAKEQWFIRTDNGMVERVYCWAHATEMLPADQSAFADSLVMGSGLGAE